MGRLLAILIFFFHADEVTHADLRVKVRSTPFYDVQIKLGNSQREFSSGESVKEQVVYLSTTKLNENEILEICYMARRQKSQPNAKNLGLVQMDYLGKGQAVENIRSLSPTGGNFVAGKKSCEKYSFKLINDAGVDTFEIAAIEEPSVPEINPAAAKVFEPLDVPTEIAQTPDPVSPAANEIQSPDSLVKNSEVSTAGSGTEIVETVEGKIPKEPKEDDISAAQARLEMLAILEKTGKECKNGDTVVNCPEAIAQIQKEITEMKNRLPASVPVESSVNVNLKPSSLPPIQLGPQKAIEIPWWMTWGKTLLISFAIGMFLFFILMTVSWWKVFAKAGHPGGYSLVPVLNLFTLWKISQTSALSMYMIFFPSIFLALGGKSLPAMASVALSVILSIGFLIVYMGVAKQFGRGRFFGVGLWLMPYVFFPILAFSSSNTDTNSPSPSPNPNDGNLNFDQVG